MDFNTKQNMTLEELHKIISKPESERDGWEWHLISKWKHNDAKAIFEMTGLDVAHLFSEPCTNSGIIIKNPTEPGIVIYTDLD